MTTNLPPSVAGGSVWTAPHVSAASPPHPARYAGNKTAAARLLISSVLIVHGDSFSLSFGLSVSPVDGNRFQAHSGGMTSLTVQTVIS